MLCYANCSLWLSTKTLQQSPSLISNEDYKQDAKKSGLMDSSVKIIDNRLNFYFSLFTLFYFILFLFFSFLFLERLGLGFICHAVTLVTNWWRSHKTDHGTWEKEVEGSRIKWCHTAWTIHAGLMSYTWSFRVGCTVVSMDHE